MFTYNTGGLFTKHHERIKKITETWDLEFMFCS